MSVIAKASGPDPREGIKEGEDVLLVARVTSIEGNALTVEVKGSC